MATQTGRGGGGRDVRDGKAETGKSRDRQEGRGGGGRDVVGGRAVTGRSASPGRAIDRSNVRGSGGYMSPTGRLAQRADVQAATRGTATDAQANAAARAWGFDPAGLIGGALGMGLGIPFGTGFAFDQLSRLAGRPMEVNMGPDVFGGTPNSISTASDYRGFGGQIAGGGTGNSRGYTPFQPARPKIGATQPVGSSIPQQQQPQNLWAKPWQGYSPFGTQNKWSWG